MLNISTLNYKVEGFYRYIREDNWFNAYDKYEIFEIEYQYRCVTKKIERRYINGVLKQEIIYPDKPCDRTLLIFPLLIIPFFRILSFFIIIFIPKKS